MGAWGIGNFDNDDAADFLGNLGDSKVSDIKSLLSKVIAQTGYVEAPESSVAIAAAEVIAALKGAPSSEAPKQISRWIEQTKPRADAEAVTLALRLISRIKVDSELKDLWEEAGRLDEWQDRVEDLVQRLRC